MSLGLRIWGLRLVILGASLVRMLENQAEKTSIQRKLRVLAGLQGLVRLQVFGGLGCRGVGFRGLW